MKMENLGQKEKNLYTNVPRHPEASNRVMYPCLSVSNPPKFMMDAKVGDKLRVEAVIEIKSKSVRDSSFSGSRADATVDVLKMGYISSAGKMSKEEFLNLDQEGKARMQEKEVLG